MLAMWRGGQGIFLEGGSVLRGDRGGGRGCRGGGLVLRVSWVDVRR